MAPEFGKSIHHLPLVPANVLKKHRESSSQATPGQASRKGVLRYVHIAQPAK
jgi:hypothetical protein